MLTKRVKLRLEIFKSCKRIKHEPAHSPLSLSDLPRDLPGEVILERHGKCIVFHARAHTLKKVDAITTLTVKGGDDDGTHVDSPAYVLCHTDKSDRRLTPQ